jgi:hypothetical protein
VLRLHGVENLLRVNLLIEGMFVFYVENGELFPGVGEGYVVSFADLGCYLGGYVLDYWEGPGDVVFESAVG